ncbi:beta-ketoacyl-[acyl-carrier-protein] synthase family protein [Aliamphritea ceti]|uniref:beta-ketoacyl-[acyl-carrier-protein] synthase family protein n=1 Tax=Aliamphritea ceti TaxID=1524258 RepID=UPI0021C3C4C0|nr:beta-ketoacyl-[acyl-carrier-protein] synthase family protein [Aliamphritea ceti]
MRITAGSKKTYLNKMGILCAAGGSAEELRIGVSEQSDYFSLSNAFGTEVKHRLGVCQQALPKIPLNDAKWQSRNNQLALAALMQIEADVKLAIEQYGSERVGIVIGTSTSGIAEGEAAIRAIQQGEAAGNYDYCVQEMGATADFIAEILNINGPVYGISTACSSGAKALTSARRLLRSGICDVVIAGGVDSLCRLTVQGFSSLDAVSSERCNPFSKNRNGINIGEGAALFILSRTPEGVELCGVGEGSDAHHISAPDPSGEGAIRSMTEALEDAELKAADINYVNLHGTATALNDQMEAKAMHKVFGSQTPCSSTKALTGHTLGAAGAVEAGICWLLLNPDNTCSLPAHCWDGEYDPELPNINLLSVTDAALITDIKYVISNSFAFGGNNISLLLGRV